jgi:murein DD-endopeptidase MepM/ murein hydrolase activator NlpD
MIIVFLCALASAPFDVREIGRKYQKQLEAADVDSLWPKLAPGMQKVFGGSKEAMKKALTEGNASDGNPLRVVEEVEQYTAGGYVYAQRTVYEKHYSQTLWSLDHDGQIIGLQRKGLPADVLSGEAPTKYGAYQTKTALKLPFHGAWKVVWGGRTLKANYHTGYVDQRFAFDVTREHKGDGKKNEDYAAFGQPVLAPAGGKIVEAVDGIDDNTPGVMNPAHACGNHVTIDHGNGEFSHLCHLQKGSLAVKAGAQVKTGELLGKCGNSGNSSEPHIHFSLENKPHEYEGEGLPAQFLDYLADGKKVARGEPVRGQLISNP